MLVEEGLVSIKEAFLDGTKIEANANRYTFVWGKAIKTNKEKMKAQLESLWAYVEESYKQELEELEKPDFEELSAEKVAKLIEKINDALKDKKVDKETKRKIRYAAKEWPGRLKEYAKKEKILKERGSYSKTDPDATFMRMKEDHMKNAHLKPTYNFMISTNKQFITCYTIEQSTTDTTALPGHLEEFKKMHSTFPDELTADAGFGSEENYEFLRENEIIPYFKFIYFHKEQSKKRKKDIFRQENLYYNSENGLFLLPNGTRNEKERHQKRRNQNRICPRVHP